MLKNELIIAVAPLPGLPTTWRSSSRHGGAGSCTSGVAVAINAGRAGVVAVAVTFAAGERTDVGDAGRAPLPPQPVNKTLADTHIAAAPARVHALMTSP